VSSFDENSLQLLLLGCREGHADARERLATLLYPRVADAVHRELARDYRRHHAWLLPLFSTGDIVQEVLAAALRSLAGDDVPDDEDGLARYLTTLVRNRIVDMIRFHEAGRRDARRRLSIDEGDGIDAPGMAAGPATSADLRDRVRGFEEVLGGFPPRIRMLLQMRMVDGLEFEEIASRLGWASRSACNKAFLQARARLLLRLRERGIDAGRAPDLDAGGPDAR
jgi:RNA polymerase sigma factor (sigma-70 family)